MTRGRALLLGMLVSSCTSTQPVPPALPTGAIGSGDESCRANLRAHAVDGLQRVTLVNEVAACVSLTPKELLLVGSVEVGIYAVTTVKPLGDCGCMSSTLAYRVTEQQAQPPGGLPPETPPLEPYRRALGSVDVTSDTRTLSLVVSPDRSAYGEAELTITLACQGPE